MRRSLIAGLGLMVGLAGGLAGCGGEPKADPSPSPSATKPTSTTPPAPRLPPAASANTKAGAIAFVQYYIDLVNHAQATGDVAALAAVEDSGCKSCENGRAYLSKIYGAGGHVEGGKWTIRRTSAERSGENWAVTVTGNFAPSDAYNSPGAPAKHADGGPALTNFVVWYSDSWRVRTWFSG